MKPAPDFSRMAPARHAGSRYDFLKSLDGSPVYQHLVREYAGCQLRAGNTKGFKRGRPYPVIAGVPWSTWEWSQPWLPQQVHERAEGLDPLHVFLKAETAKWVRGGIDMERLEQVLLAVGLSLRDLCTAQFTNDPDERPADISAYILDSKLPFAEYEKLLGALRLFKDVRITFGNASSSTVQSPSRPGPSSQPRPRPIYSDSHTSAEKAVMPATSNKSIAIPSIARASPPPSIPVLPSIPKRLQATGFPTLPANMVSSPPIPVVLTPSPAPSPLLGLVLSTLQPLEHPLPTVSVQPAEPGPEGGVRGDTPGTTETINGVEMPPPPTPPTFVEVGPKRPSPGPSDDGGQPAKRQKRRGQGEESGTTKPPSPPTQVPSRSARPQRTRKLPLRFQP